MKYLCKKSYPDFIVGKYYYSENYDYEGFIIINQHMFFDFPEIKTGNIHDYFETMPEIRRKKLAKLQEFK